jgi:hypothetical protein
MRDMKKADPRPGPAAKATWRGNVLDAMRPHYHAAILAGGRDFLTRTLSIRKKAAALIHTKAPLPGAKGVVVSLEQSFSDRIMETVDTTVDGLQEVLDEAVADGLDASEIDDLISQEWDDVLGSRTDTIATTETNGAINSVRDYLALQLVELQYWMTAQDERVRPTHVIYGEAGSKPVGFDWSQLADDAGYTLRFPCDPECHEPSEVVNCRCFTVPDGEVDLAPDELADYLADFEMDPEDLLLSEDQTATVFGANPEKGISKDFDETLHPRDEHGRFTANPWSGRFYPSDTGEIARGDEEAAAGSDSEARAEWQTQVDAVRDRVEELGRKSDAAYKMRESTQEHLNSVVDRIDASVEESMKAWFAGHPNYDSADAENERTRMRTEIQNGDTEDGKAYRAALADANMAARDNRTAADALTAAEDELDALKGNQPTGTPDPTTVGTIAERNQVMRDAIDRMRADVPTPERMAELRNEESNLHSPALDKAVEDAKTFRDKAEAAGAEYMKLQSEYGAKRDAAMQQGAKNAVETFYAQHPELDLRNISNEDREKDYNDLSNAKLRAIGDTDAAKAALDALPKAKDPNQEAEDNLFKRAMSDPAVAAAMREKYTGESIPSDAPMREMIAREAEAADPNATVARDSDLVKLKLDAMYEAEENRLRVEKPEKYGGNADALNAAMAKFVEARDRAVTTAVAQDRYRNAIEMASFADKGSWESAYGQMRSDQGDRSLISDDEERGKLDQIAGTTLVNLEATQEYKDLNEAKNLARTQMDEYEQTARMAQDQIGIEKEKLLDEFAQKAGPGYFYARAMADDDYYNKNMDDLREGWQHIGGEGPSRLRAAVGIGLGLETGAIYDKKQGGFLTVDKYGDLRDDFKTIQYAGLLRREYAETQEDIVNGKLGSVETLGQEHMGGKEPSSGGDSEDDPEQTWSDDEKYDEQAGKEDWYQSDEFSNDEFQAQSYDWENNTSDDSKLTDYATGNKGDLAEAEIASAKAFASKDAAESASGWSDLGDVNDASIAEQARYLREKLGTDFVEGMVTPDEAKVRHEAESDVHREMVNETLAAQFRVGAWSGAEQMLGAALTPEVREALGKIIDDPQFASTSGFSAAQRDYLDLLLQTKRDAFGDKKISTSNWRVEARAALSMAESVAGKESVAIASLPLDDPNIQARVDDAHLNAAREYLQIEAADLNWSKLYKQTVGDHGTAWRLLKDEETTDVFPNGVPRALKYSNGDTLENDARQRFSEDWQWDDSDVDDSWNNWWSEHKSEYETAGFAAAKAEYEAGQQEKVNQATIEEPKTAAPAAAGEAPHERGYVQAYRGLNGAPTKYIHSFTDSWSTSRNKARDFGSRTILDWKIPVERLLVFQGARNWAAEKVGGMGNTEFEVMPLSDMPKWYRESYRAYMRAKSEASKRQKAEAKA